MHVSAIEVLERHVARNIPEYVTFFGALAIAAVCTMPEKCPIIIGPIDSPIKQSVQDLWTWFRNAIQTAVPAARNGHPPQNPIPPGTNPAQPKEGK